MTPTPPTTPVYELRLEVDAPIVAVTGTFAAAWLLQGQLAPAYCAPLCDASHVNAIDRGVAGRYDQTWARTSDVTIGAVFVGVVTTMVVDEGARAGLSDSVVVVESFLTADALSVVSTMSTRRPRPFMYGENAPLSARTDGNGALSFFSGHTAGGFALTTSLFSTLWRREPGRALPWVALGVGLSASTFLGTTRVLAGQHFPTDVAAGAVVGSAAGFLLPAMHRSPVQILPVTTVAGREGLGLVVTGTF